MALSAFSVLSFVVACGHEPRETAEASKSDLADRIVTFATAAADGRSVYVAGTDCAVAVWRRDQPHVRWRKVDDITTTLDSLEATGPAACVVIAGNYRPSSGALANRVLFCRADDLEPIRTYALPRDVTVRAINDHLLAVLTPADVKGRVQTGPIPWVRVTFWRCEGNKLAPVFELPVLPDASEVFNVCRLNDHAVVVKCWASRLDDASGPTTGRLYVFDLDSRKIVSSCELPSSMRRGGLAVADGGRYVALVGSSRVEVREVSTLKSVGSCQPT